MADAISRSVPGFTLCDTCANKPGSPELCSGCGANQRAAAAQRDEREFAERRARRLIDALLEHSRSPLYSDAARAAFRMACYEASSTILQMVDWSWHEHICHELGLTVSGDPLP